MHGKVSDHATNLLLESIHIPGDFLKLSDTVACLENATLVVIVHGNKIY